MRMNIKQTPIFIILVCLLLLISCKSTTGPATPNNKADDTPQTIQAGEWTTTTTFGTFSFTVDSSNNTITDITIIFSGWNGFSGSVKVSQTPAWTINNRGFSITTNIMSNPWTFVGAFDNNGIKASGTWSTTTRGSSESGTWEAAPKT